MDDFDDLLDLQQQLEVSRGVHRRPATLRDRLNPLEAYDDVDFYHRYRVKKEGFLLILQSVEPLLPQYRKKTNSPLSPVQQLSVAQRFFATGDFQISCGDFQGISQSTVCRMVHRVTNAIATLSSQEIVFPDDTSETNKWFLEYCGLPAISGVVDGSHIPIQSPGGTDAELFRCRKTFFSFNTQFVCDERLRIIDVVSGWPGSTHDSRIWNNSKLITDFETGVRQGILLGDSAYPLTPYLMTPYPHPPNSRAKGKFNKALCKARGSIERCIGVLKRRWPCLSRGLRCSHTNVPNIIVACAVLHNLCIKYNQSLYELEDLPVEADEDDIHAIDADEVEYRPGEDFVFQGEEVREMLTQRFE